MATLNYHRLHCVSVPIIFLLSASCSAENVLNEEETNIAVDNLVADCFSAKSVKSHIHNNVILIDMNISHVKDVGYCGCKSALLSYYAVPSNNKSNMQIKEYRVFSSLRRGVYTFIVENDYVPNMDLSYTLNIQCASSGS